jgi:hypothetical protein
VDQPEPDPNPGAGAVGQPSGRAKIVAFPKPMVETEEPEAATPPADAVGSPASEDVVEDSVGDEDGPIQLQAEIPSDEEITSDADPDASANEVEAQPEPGSVTSPPAEASGEQPET